MDNAWEKSTLEKVLLETIKEQRRSRRWKLFFRLIWVAIIGIILFNVFDGKSKISAEKGKHVAVINLNGTICDENNTYETIVDGVKEALEDKKYSWRNYSRKFSWWFASVFKYDLQ